MAAAIGGIEVVYRRGVDENGDPDVDTIRKVKLIDKLGALNSLAKHFGLFEKNNHQKRPSLEQVFLALKAVAPDLAAAVRSVLLKQLGSTG